MLKTTFVWVLPGEKKMKTNFLVKMKGNVQCLFTSHNSVQMTTLKWSKITSLFSNFLGKEMTWSC